MVNLPVSEVMHVEPPTLEIYRYSVANATKLYLLNTIAPTYYFSNVLFFAQGTIGDSSSTLLHWFCCYTLDTVIEPLTAASSVYLLLLWFGLPEYFYSH